MTDLTLLELIIEYGDLMRAHALTPDREYDEEAGDLLATIRQKLVTEKCDVIHACANVVQAMNGNGHENP